MKTMQKPSVKSLSLLLSIAMFILLSLTVTAQCPITCQTSYTDVDCFLQDGKITIDITNCPTPFTLKLTHLGSSTEVYSYYGSTYSHSISNLSSGVYQVYIVHPVCDPYFENIELEEYNHNWPILPANDYRATAVDVEVDPNKDVVATGYWNGMINFVPPYSNSAYDMNSAGQADVYLVKYDRCGELQWQQQVFAAGIDNQGCKVNALVIDPDNNIIACGSYTNGDAVFPGNPNIVLPYDANNPYGAWVAKFERGSGLCVWAMRIVSTREVYAKDVCIYQTGEIFVFCDYKNYNASIYDASSPLVPVVLTKSNLTFDAFLLALDEDGNYIEHEAIDQSTVSDDYAGGLCCFTSPQGNPVVEIILTGSTNGAFLGERWYYDPASPPYLTFQTDINLYSTGTSIDAGKFGLATESWLDPTTNLHSFAFTGYYLGNGTATGPFLASSYTPNSAPPATQLTNEYLPFLNSATISRFNLGNSLTINTPTGGLFMGGIVNDLGDHPFNPLGTYFSITPSSSGSFFVDKFPISSTGLNSIEYEVHSDDGTANYSQYPLTVPGYLGLGSDQSGKTFVSGSYIDFLESPSGLTIPPSGSAGVYIARLCEELGGSPYFKNTINLSSRENNESDFLYCYPNPAESVINLQTNLTDGKIEILSIDGRLIIQMSSEGLLTNSNRIPLANIDAGIYFLKLSNETTCLTSKILIVR
jgi:hypothetical protein